MKKYDMKKHESRQERILKVIMNRNLTPPCIAFALQEIYAIVEKNVDLTYEDWEKEPNGDIKWHHAVRAILKHHKDDNSQIHKVASATYSFS